MKTGKLSHKVLAMSAFALVVGCAGTPVATTPTVDQAAPQADRQVLSVTQDATLESEIKQLPQRISVADANKMLVELDPDKIQANEGKGYSVQRYRGGYRGYGRGYWGGYRYYGLGGRYWPYARYGGFYYPYFYGSYYPYLYPTAGLYASSYYYNPFFAYSNPWITSYAYRGLYRWPGIYL